MSAPPDAGGGRDITIAFTPTQLVLMAIAAYVLLRFLRGLRE